MQVRFLFGRGSRNGYRSRTTLHCLLTNSLNNKAQPNKLRIKGKADEKYEEKLLAKANVISASANRLWRKFGVSFLSRYWPTTRILVTVLVS